MPLHLFATHQVSGIAVNEKYNGDIMKSKLYLILISMVIMVSGCAGILYPISEGNEKITDESLIKQIKPNVTTMQEVNVLLGPPYRVTRSSEGITKWEYIYNWHAPFNTKSESTTLDILFRDNIVVDLDYGALGSVGMGWAQTQPVDISKGQVVQKVPPQTDANTQSHPSVKPIPTVGEKKASKYMCWGLGVIVITNEKATIIEEIQEQSYSSAKEFLKVGDEIIKVGDEDITADNAIRILSQPIANGKDGLVPVSVKRDGKVIQYRINQNVYLVK